jgi:hypothetical protein
MGYSMKLIDSSSQELIMKLGYKAKINDIIRNDDTRKFYKVISVDSDRRECFAKRDYLSDEQFN